MKIVRTGICAAAIAGVAIIAAANTAAQGPFGDAEIMIGFQRAADSYAFGHRQLDRRAEGPVTTVEGALFTPIVADAFRKRIRRVTAGGACKVSDAAIHDFSVPRSNAPAAATPAVPACIVAVLPPLPEELEYRVRGVALLLVDAHLHIVVDVLHAAFPPPARDELREEQSR